MKTYEIWVCVDIHNWYIRVSTIHALLNEYCYLEVNSSLERQHGRPDTTV